MSRGKELAKNTIIITIGKISTQFISFILLPLYTSLLSTSEYGTVDLLNTYVQLLLPVVTLMIEQGAFRYLIDHFDDEENKRKIISSSLFVLLGQCVLFGIIFLVAGHWVKNDYKYYLLVILIVASFSGWSLQLARGFRKLSIYAAGSFITTMVQISFNILFIAGLKMGAVGMLRATFLGNTACFVFVLLYLKVYKYIRLRAVEKDTIRDMLKYSVPLIPNQLSLWVINSSDRTIVNLFLGTAANGILAVSHKFSTIYQTIYSMFQLSWHETSTVHFQDDDRDEFFSETFADVYRFFMAMCLGLIAFMPFVFPVLIKEAFASAYYTVPIYLVAVLCNIVVGLLGAVYVATKKTAEIAKSTIYSGIINVIVHVALIKSMGLYAAALSTLVGYFTVMLFRMKDTKKYLNIKYEYSIFALTVVMIGILLVPYYVDNLILRICGAVLACIVAILLNKKMLMAIMKEVLVGFKRK